METKTKTLTMEFSRLKSIDIHSNLERFKIINEIFALTLKMLKRNSFKNELRKYEGEKTQTTTKFTHFISHI